MYRKNIFGFFFIVSFFSFVTVFALDITVFLVEDDSTARKIISKTLSEQEKMDINFEVVKLPGQGLAGSPNGQGAIDWYRDNYETLKNKPLIFLMDFNLKGNLTGLQTMRAIKDFHSKLDAKEYFNPIFIGISSEKENNQTLEEDGAEGSSLKHQFKSSFVQMFQNLLVKRGIILGKTKKRKPSAPQPEEESHPEKKQRPDELAEESKAPMEEMVKAPEDDDQK